MQKFKEKMKAFWVKTKAFMLKKYYGIPVWGYTIGVVLVVPVLIFSFFVKRPKKSKV